MKESNLSFKNIFKRETKLATYIIVVTTILVLGLSYALFFQVNSNSGNQVVKSGDLAFTYSKNGTVLENNDTSLAIDADKCFYPMSEGEADSLMGDCSYQFSIQNTGTLKAAYSMILKATASNTANPEHLKIILRQSDGTTFQKMTGYPKTVKSVLDNDGILMTGDLDAKSSIYVYNIQIYLDESLAVESDYPSKVVSYQLEGKSVVHEDQPITTVSSAADATLATLQALDSSLKLNESMNSDPGTCPTYDATTKTIDVTAGEEDASLLCEAEDDYGTSYYFRGNVINNYVSFAGFTWRIVRINGDGSIRLIYDGTTPYKNIKEGGSEGDGANRQIGTRAFNSSSYTDNAYVGYMYKATGQSSYAATFDVMNNKNASASTVKGFIDSWYANNIDITISGKSKKYSDYVSLDTIFCNDKNISETTSSGYTIHGYGMYTTAYRWYYGPWDAAGSGRQLPRFTCVNTQGEVDSKNDAFTVSDKGNGALTYPVALLTTDEAVAAGGYSGYFAPISHYLRTGSWYWTMSPNKFYYTYATSMDVRPEGYTYGGNFVDDAVGVRPVLSLDYGVDFASGDGTYEHPFVVDVS